MKKVIVFALSLMLVLTSFTACSQDGKKMLENMEKAGELKLVNQSVDAEYKVNVKNIFDYVSNVHSLSMYAIVNQENEDDMSKQEKEIIEQKKKMEKIFSKYPVATIKAKGKSYIDLGDSNKINAMEANLDFDINAFGIDSKMNVHILMDEENMYLEKQTLVDIKKAVLETAEKAFDLDKDKIAELDKEMEIPEEDYIMASLESAGMNQGIKFQPYSEEVKIENPNKVFAEAVSKIDVDLSVSKKDGMYTVKIPVKKITKAIPQYMSGIVDYIKKENKSKEVSDKDFEKARAMFTSKIAKIYLAAISGVFDNSEVVYANSYENDVFKQKMQVKLFVADDEILTAKSSQESELTDKKELEYPSKEDCLDASKMNKNQEPEPRFYPEADTEEIAEKEENAKIDKKTVSYNNQKVSIDGKNTKLRAFNIGGNNYVMLRDLARKLKDTDSKFYVGYNKELKAIEMDTKKEYVDGAVQNIKVSPLTIDFNPHPVYLNGSRIYIDGFLINNNTYFKLRDLADVLDFEVDYDASKNIVIIKTK